MKYLSLTTFIFIIILSLDACDAKDLQPSELVCSGKATLGSDDVLADQFVLRIQDNSIEIRGMPGTPVTFDGTVYKVCLDSKNEVDFEYTTSSCQSGNTTRTGTLDKVTGELTLQRFDMGQPFTGTYRCKPAHRVLQ